MGLGAGQLISYGAPKSSPHKSMWEFFRNLTIPPLGPSCSREGEEVTAALQRMQLTPPCTCPRLRTLAQSRGASREQELLYQTGTQDLSAPNTEPPQLSQVKQGQPNVNCIFHGTNHLAVQGDLKTGSSLTGDKAL